MAAVNSSSVIAGAWHATHPSSPCAIPGVAPAQCLVVGLRASTTLSLPAQCSVHRRPSSPSITSPIARLESRHSSNGPIRGGSPPRQLAQHETATSAHHRPSSPANSP
jgi:hypothetical protein